MPAGTQLRPLKGNKPQQRRKLALLTLTLTLTLTLFGVAVRSLARVQNC